MRLIHTTSMTLYEFEGSAVPEYAILSHRWEEEEVSFQDFTAMNPCRRIGRRKIELCCRKAAADGWQYVWIDTCCINKTSSAELSEAINSMYKWYESAQICYAYLSDVPPEAYDTCRDNSAFRRSAWFTRGWTLQELLAPRNVVFLDNSWEWIGTKSTLKSLISSITGIQDLDNVSSASVAQKMSWAAHRQTTRSEDRAYCLLGLFDVNLPLLYGEGEKAFLRLQYEIFKQSDDESLFAWVDEPNKMTSLLANSPSQFAGSSDVASMDFDGARPPFSMTNKGLRLELLCTEDYSGVLVAPLNCTKGSGESPLSITLVSAIGKNQFWRRHEPVTNLSMRSSLSSKREHLFRGRREIYVRHDLPISLIHEDFEEVQPLPRSLCRPNKNQIIFCLDYRQGLTIDRVCLYQSPNCYWRKAKLPTCALPGSFTLLSDPFMERKAVQTPYGCAIAVLTQCASWSISPFLIILGHRNNGYDVLNPVLDDYWFGILDMGKHTFDDIMTGSWLPVFTTCDPGMIDKYSLENNGYRITIKLLTTEHLPLADLKICRLGIDVKKLRDPGNPNKCFKTWWPEFIPGTTYIT